MKTQRFYNIVIFSTAISLLAIVGIVVTLIFPRNNSTIKMPISPTPIDIKSKNYDFPELSPLPTLRTITDDSTSLAKKMPVESDGFNIEYLSTSNTFIVTIKKNPYQSNLALAKAWFQKEGVNVDSINILIYKYRFVQ